MTALLTEPPRTRPPSPTARDWSRTAALVERAQTGDRAAFGLLVEQFEPTVHALCRQRLGPGPEAAELSQEVFLHAMRRLGQLRQPERFAGWLKQMTVRMAINRATRRVAPPSVDREQLEATAAPRREPVEELIARERARLLHEALGRLNAMDRETLAAFYLQGLSIVEVAERHEAPVGTIKRRLHTARKRLKALLRATSDAWADAPDDDDEDADDASDFTPRPRRPRALALA